MSPNTDRTNYMVDYKNHYKKIKKIVTFALPNEDYVLLAKAANSTKQTTNIFAKNITINFIHSYHEPVITDEQKVVIREFIRITRGIANNINQLAYRANAGEFVDLRILFNGLKAMDRAFEDYIIKGGNR